MFLSGDVEVVFEGVENGSPEEDSSAAKYALASVSAVHEISSWLLEIVNSTFPCSTSL